MSEINYISYDPFKKAGPLSSPKKGDVRKKAEQEKDSATVQDQVFISITGNEANKNLQNEANKVLHWVEELKQMEDCKASLEEISTQYKSGVYEDKSIIQQAVDRLLLDVGYQSRMN